jgi:phytoene dehydrogenase-like protein
MKKHAKQISIVGSGISGLTAGTLLARKGHKVTIFESQSASGGSAVGFRRNGFYFESGTLAFESSSLVFKALKELGVYEKLTFERHSYRFLSEEYDGTPSTYEDFKALLYAAYPLQKANLDLYFHDVDKMYYTTAALAGRASALKKLVSMVRRGRFLKYKNQPMGQFTAHYFQKSSTLYRMLSAIGYPDMSAFLLGGALYTLFEDSWTIKEGFQALADALVDAFKAAGGELKLGAPVEKILTRHGMAVGVRSKDEDFPADGVIAACDYKKTFLSLLDRQDVPPQLHEKIRNTQVSEGQFVVYLGLRISNEELCQKMGKEYVLCGEEVPRVDIRNPNDITYFERTGFSLYSLSLKNPALAPAGRSSLMITTIAPWHWLSNWGGGNRQKYQQLKTDAMDTLIARVDAVIPGLKNSIEVKDAATPLTFERYTGNTDGATAAWGWNPQKHFYPSMTGTNIDTPVKNLFIGSSWATQVGGVLNAINAAYACAKRIG